MELHKVVKKAMIDKNIDNAVELAELCDVPYTTLLTVIRGQNTSILTASKVLDSLGLKLCVVNKGE